MSVPRLRASQPLGNLGHHGSNELSNKTTTTKACKEASFEFVVDADLVLLGLGINNVCKTSRSNATSTNAEVPSHLTVQYFASLSKLICAESDAA